MDLAVLVDQERAHQECGLRRRAAATDGGLHRCKAREEAPVAPRELIEIPALRCEAAVGGEVAAAAAQQQRIGGAVEVAQPAARLPGTASRMREQ